MALRPLLLAGAVGCVAAAPASAATTLGSTAGAAAGTTLGSTTGVPNSNLTGGCPMPPVTCAYFTTGPSPSLVVPSDGVIVAWRVRAGSVPPGGTAALRIIRPAGGGTFTGAGRSAVVSPVIDLNAYTTRLRVRAGDIIGMESDSQHLFLDNTAAGYTATYFSAGLDEGGTIAASGTQGATRLLVSAVLEADADGDGFGDETQDEC